jgi:hypothetical protein
VELDFVLRELNFDEDPSSGMAFLASCGVALDPTGTYIDAKNSDIRGEGIAAETSTF